MSDLKDMSMSEEKKKDFYAPELIADKTEYPYGLTITLDPDTLDKLELGKTPQVGDKLTVLAIVEVKNVSDENGRGDVEKRSITLQITQMDAKKVEKENSADDFYKKES